MNRVYGKTMGIGQWTDRRHTGLTKEEVQPSYRQMSLRRSSTTIDQFRNCYHFFFHFFIIRAPNNAIPC